MLNKLGKWDDPNIRRRDTRPISQSHAGVMERCRPGRPSRPDFNNRGDFWMRARLTACVQSRPGGGAAMHWPRIVTAHARCSPAAAHSGFPRVFFWLPRSDA